MIDKLDACRACPLFGTGTGFINPEGSPLLGVTLVGEAGGENEAYDGLPFRPYAQAGSILERALRRNGYSRTQFRTFNVLQCFVSPRTSIYTPEGYRGLSSLKEGDLALTHKGRFRPIEHVIKNSAPVDVLKISLRQKGYAQGWASKPFHVMVTDNHQFFSDNSWKYASDFVAGDRLLYLAEECLECGKPVVRHFTKRNDSMAFCGVNCHNKFVARNSGDKLKEIMLEAYASGKRDPYTITKAANEAFRTLLKNGWRPNPTEEGAHNHRIKTALAKQALRLAGSKWIGFGERALGVILEASGHDFVSQFAIDGLNYDFKVGEVLIEVDGPGKSNRGLRQAIKDEMAEGLGYRVIHVPHDKVEVALELLKNDDHEFVFSEIEIEKIEYLKWTRGTWTLSVAEDESYIGQGLVSHNCQPPGNFLLHAPYEHDVIHKCLVHRDPLLRTSMEAARAMPGVTEPVILAMGDIALRTLTGMSGPKQGITNLRGYPMYTPYGLVIGTLHPAFVRREMKSFGILVSDIASAVQIAREGFHPLPLSYLQRPTESQVRDFRDRVLADPSLLVSFDIETIVLPKFDRRFFPQITSVQYSLAPGTGIYLPWNSNTIPVIKEINASKNDKVGHNSWSFDVPALAQYDAPIKGRVDDTLWCLAGHTQVALWNGGHAYIMDLVRNGEKVTLIGMDKDGVPIPVTVTKWHQTKVNGQEWIRIKTRESRYPLYLTPEHKVWANDMWVRADEVRPGAVLRLPSKGSGWLEQGVARVAVVTEVGPSNDWRITSSDRYCADVAHETHAFFAMGGLVHNCYHHYQPDLSSEETRGESEDGASASLSTRAGLQAVASFFGMDFPWKHKNESEPEFYGIADVDAVQRIMADLPDRMKNLGIWEGYDRKVRQFRPVLNGAEVRGIPIDEMARLDLKDVLRVKKIELDGVLQELYPHELKAIDPKNGYTRSPRPKEGKIRAAGDGYEWFYDPQTKASKKRGKKSEFDTAIAKEGPLARWLPLEQRVFKVVSKVRVPCACAVEAFQKSGSKAKKPAFKKYAEPTCTTCEGRGVIIQTQTVTESRWVKVKPFKPSKQQLIKYMNFVGHKVPKALKSKKDTTGAQQLKEHAKKYKDPLYQGVLDSRTVDKMDSTYVEGYAPSNVVLYDFDGVQIPIGTVHTEFTFAPATGQLSSRGPNVQNAPKHTRNKNLAPLELPTRFRRMVRARPGHRLWGFDYKSAHALTLGFEAKDLDYMRLARLDIHSYLTSVLVGAPIDLKLSDADLKLALSEIKKRFQTIRDTQAKPAILGYGFGLGAYKLHDQNKAQLVDGTMVGFQNVKEAQKVIDRLNETFPKTAAFRNTIKVLAHKQHYLVSMHGFIRWFWDVFNFLYDANSPEHYQTLHGTDTEDSIAFLPANDAFGHIRDASLVLEEEGLNDFSLDSKFGIGGFINNEHDALKFEIPISIEDRVVPRIKAIMEAPSRVLVNEIAPTGLFIEVEAERGPNWAEMEKVKI